MNISPNGLRLIQSEEGFSATVYNDIAGNPTIGYGHKLQPGEHFPDGVTQALAVALLDQDLALVEVTLIRLVPADCTQNQYDALCDFGFNLGVGALKIMLAHGWDQVPTQILRWDMARVNGVEVVNADLKTRRAAEFALFNTPD